MLKKIILFIIVGGIATHAFCAERMAIRKFGGLNTRTNPYEISESESPDCSNFVLDEAGSLTRRELFKRYNSTSIGNTCFTNLYKFYTVSDAGYLILSGGTSLYKATGGTISDISITSNTVVSDTQWSFETFTDGTNDLVFGANQGTTLASWNGTDATFKSLTNNATPNTRCNILKKHKARLWASGSANFPYRVYYSSLNNGIDWVTTGGSLDLPSYEKIMALEVLSDTLFIFTRTSIYAVLGDTPSEFSIQKTRSTVGTHSFKSVVLGDRLIYFLNKSGVFVFDGDTSVNISETIQPTIDSISNTYIGNSASLFDKRGRYWLSYTSTNGTYNDSILVYDTVLKQWYKLDNANFSAFLRLDGGTDKGEIFATCSNSIGYLWQLQSGSGIEQITYSTLTQLQTLITFNTVLTQAPTIELKQGNDTYTKLLAHFNGLDTVTTYRSEDYAHRTATFNGDAQLDIAQKEFGNSSVLLDGAGDDVDFPDSNDWYLSTNDFTIDFWVRFSDITGSQDLFGQWEVISNYYRLSLNLVGNDGKLRFLADNSVNADFQTTSSCNMVADTWYHIALVRNGSNAYIFVNGVSQALTTTTAFGDLSNNAATFTIGSDGTNANYTKGHIDEFRFSKGISRWTANFSPYLDEYNSTVEGTVTSVPIQINASGSASLGTIKWQETLDTNTDIQFTTRTGATNDTVYYNGWESWVSSNVVTLNTVTDATVWMPLTGATVYFSAQKPDTPQSRNILLYETYDTVSATCVEFIAANGVYATGKYCDTTVPEVNLTNDKFIGFWLKSPTTGNSAQLGIGEVSGTVTAYITANTVMADTWEFHYWPIGNYTSTDIDSIKFMRLTYLGDKSGTLYLGDVSAYNFLDNEDTITSTPNDYIQFRGILGSTIVENSPVILSTGGYAIQLSYTATSGASESSLNSYWKSKVFDGGTSVNKLWQWLSFNVESQNPTTGHTVYLNYWTDDGRQSGTVSQTVNVTGNTTNIKFYLPSGTYGKSFQFEFEDSELNDQLKIKNCEIYVIPEAGY